HPAQHRECLLHPGSERVHGDRIRFHDLLQQPISGGLLRNAMRLILCAILALASVPAFAQQASPPSYTFSMTPDEANTMFGQLGKLDWVAVNPLMQKLIAQLQA